MRASERLAQITYPGSPEFQTTPFLPAEMPYNSFKAGLASLRLKLPQPLGQTASEGAWNLPLA